MIGSCNCLITGVWLQIATFYSKMFFKTLHDYNFVDELKQNT